jgi:hypothetical protein
VLVFGVGTLPPPGGGGAKAATDDFADFGSDAPAATPSSAAGAIPTIGSSAGGFGTALVSAAGAGGATASGGGPGQPPTPIDASLRLLCPLTSWAAAVPIARFSYADVGVRPFDAANASFTVELWAQVSSL